MPSKRGGKFIPSKRHSKLSLNTEMHALSIPISLLDLNITSEVE